MSKVHTVQGNFVEAKRQQDKADHFTLVEVILASALLLYGIAGVTRNWTLKFGTLGTGAVDLLHLARLAAHRMTYR